MARTKKVSSEKDIEEKTEQVKEENKNTSSYDDTIAELKKQIAELSKTVKGKDEEINKMLELSKTVISSTEDKKVNEKPIPVKCLELNGVQLSSPNRDTIVMLPYNTWVDCDKYDLTQIFKKLSNRSLFEDGICIMEGNALEDFKIKKRNDIQEDKILELLDSGDEQKITKEFNKLTNNKKNMGVGHLIFYMIVGASLDGKLKRVPNTSVVTVENYFEYKMKDAEILLKMFRDYKK